MCYISARPQFPHASSHLVVAALHEVLLQGHGVLDVDVVVDGVRRQQLQLSVELAHPVLSEQRQQVQPQQLQLVSRLGQLGAPDRRTDRRTIGQRSAAWRFEVRPRHQRAVSTLSL